MGLAVALALAWAKALTVALTLAFDFGFWHLASGFGFGIWHWMNERMLRCSCCLCAGCCCPLWKGLSVCVWGVRVLRTLLNSSKSDDGTKMGGPHPNSPGES